jgi:hypothetical protein
MKAESHEYEGRKIEVREREGKRELLIDNKTVRYGQLPNGKYFLRDYAYDWSDDLVEVARRYIKYRQRVEKIRQERSSSKGGK